MSPLLIGLCGNAGVGKDTFAETFHSFGFRQYSFAGPVKDVCCAAFGISPDYFTDRQLKEEVHPYWERSPRELAQLVGTELFREYFGDNFWIKNLELQLILDFDSNEDVKAIISDVRFQNEAQWILDNGGVLVHLTRPGYTGNVGIPGHASEAGIDFRSLRFAADTKQVHFVLNDGTLSDLEDKALAFIDLLPGAADVSNSLQVIDCTWTDSSSCSKAVVIP